ncbi:MAG: hypothetical protein MUF23_17880 [Pirellula sp.]|jgi:hypothetical protein|nr:hypothetical protein [Pirellula sp.]
MEQGEVKMEGKPWWKLASIWLAGAALSGPIGIVLHELAHYLAAVSFSFPEVKINYASINYAQSEEFWAEILEGDRAGAAAIHPPNYVGIVSIAGPLLTIVLSLGSALMLRSKEFNDLAAALLAGFALMAGVRSLTGLSYIIYVRPNYPGAIPYFDEINAARAFGIPVDYFVWPLCLGLILSWFIAIPQLRPGLAIKLPAAIIGPVLGIALWAVIGPTIWS